MASTFGPIPPHHDVTIRLTNNNFIIWRALSSSPTYGVQSLWATSMAPLPHLSSLSLPQLLLILTLSLIRPMIGGMIRINRSLRSSLLHVWGDSSRCGCCYYVQGGVGTLQRMFSSSTRAHVIYIRVDLATSKKCDLSAVDYSRKIKGLATDL